MKRSLFAIALLAISSSLFFSCKKSDTSVTATYYIKGKKDGVAFIFITNTGVSIVSSPPASIFSLKAFGDGMEGFNIGISFSNGGTLQTGTYREDYSGTSYGIGGVYNPNSTTMVYAAGIQASANPLVINILTMTSTEVSGTFSGAFYRQSVTGTFYPDFITITDGEFRLQLK